ncbi:MAG: amino acid permease [Nitrospiraceae bacterium]|nr:amino acid permease [Nitrospiraceae bacterium]
MAFLHFYQETRKSVVRFREAVLNRVVGVGALFSSGYGDVGSSIYFALGVTTVYAGGASFLAIFVAGIFFVATVLSYAELSSAIPEAGGSSLFAQRAFGDGWAFFAGWALLLDYIITLAISAFSVGPYLGYFFPILKTNVQANVTFTGGLILLLIVLNVFGLRESSRMSLILAGFDIVTQLSLMILGLIFLFDLPRILHQFSLGTNPTWPHFLYGISVAMVAYIGIEAISQMSAEARDPGKSVPRAMFMTMGTTVLLYSGISLVAVSAMSPTLLSTVWVNDPIAGIAHYLPHVHQYMGPWVALLGATILTVAANAGLIGVSRLAFSMSHNFLIHPIFRHTPRGFRTPVYSLVFFGALGALVMAFFPYLEVLADLYNYGAMLSFTMTHLALIRLRKTEPDLPRPFRVPLSFRVLGHEIPVPALIGLLGTGAVFLMVLLFHKYGRVFGTLWMIGGVLYYYLYRKGARMPLMERLSVTEIPEPPAPAEDRHGAILVATSPTAPSPLLSDVLKVARTDGARVLVVTVLEVPLALPLYAPLPEEEETARRTLALCQALGVDKDVLVDTLLLRGRSAAEVLVRTLRREKIDTLVVNDTDSAIVRGIKASVLRSGLPVTLWTVRRPSPGRTS